MQKTDTPTKLDSPKKSRGPVTPAYTKHRLESEFNKDNICLERVCNHIVSINSDISKLYTFLSYLQHNFTELLSCKKFDQSDVYKFINLLCDIVVKSAPSDELRLIINRIIVSSIEQKIYQQFTTQQFLDLYDRLLCTRSLVISKVLFNDLIISICHCGLDLEQLIAYDEDDKYIRTHIRDNIETILKTIKLSETEAEQLREFIDMPSDDIDSDLAQAIKDAIDPERAKILRTASAAVMPYCE